jgi:hypothetical protein
MTSFDRDLTSWAREEPVGLYVRLTHTLRPQAYSVEVSIMFQLNERIKLAARSI